MTATNRTTLAVAACLMGLCHLTAAQAEIAGLGSREYKVGLDPAALPQDPSSAIAAIEDRLAPVKPMEFQGPRHGKVQFFDTADCTLTRHSMLLRSREKAGKAPRLTLKIRNHDILVVDAMPIRPVRSSPADIEDDYSIGPNGKPASNFSRSFSFDAPPPKALTGMAQHVLHLEDVISAPADATLQAGPSVAETMHVSNAIRLADGTDIAVEISLWYARVEAVPLAGDVSFTVEAPFSYKTLQAADTLLQDFAKALGPLKGASGEKALAVLPEACR